MRKFLDRADAGRRLSAQLARFKGREDVLILALPRGGVPVGFEIAEALHARLDIFLVRKLGFPGHEEFALGAIASGGVRVLNPGAFRIADVSDEEVDEIAAREEEELNRREFEYRGAKPHPEVRGKIVLLVDDGLATGSTMRAAVAALREMGPAKIIVAVPVASADACELLSREADEVVCAAIPEPFYAVGQWYQNFSQTTDEEVKELLEKAGHHLQHSHPS